MSRIAKAPIEIPESVQLSVDNGQVKVKGTKGELEFNLPTGVNLELEDGQAKTSLSGRQSTMAMAGTVRSIVADMVEGVSKGFEKKLELVGVGYRAQAQGKTLKLSLGLSHPVNYELPDGITAETPSQTEIVLKGSNKVKLGQVAADIRAYRKPEPYKGKGIKYSGERILRKEAKKK